MPYRTIRESLAVCTRKPGWIWRYGNAANANYDVGTWAGPLAVRNMGGITTRVKVIEMVGEVVNDATAAPDPIIVTSPMVLLGQFMASFEGAASGEAVTNYTYGDPSVPVVDEILTGQPWNYMFPTPSSSSSLGTSAVIGALTSGI